MNRNSYDELRVELYELMDRLKKERYIPAETLCGLTFCEMQVLRWVYMANQRNEDAKPSDMARRFSHHALCRVSVHKKARVARVCGAYAFGR